MRLDATRPAIIENTVLQLTLWFLERLFAKLREPVVLDRKTILCSLHGLPVQNMCVVLSAGWTPNFCIFGASGIGVIMRKRHHSAKE